MLVRGLLENVEKARKAWPCAVMEALATQRNPRGTWIQAELRTIDRAFEGVDLLYLSIFPSIYLSIY